MDLDPIVLWRLRFARVIDWHILLPALVTGVVMPFQFGHFPDPDDGPAVSPSWNCANTRSAFIF